MQGVEEGTGDQIDGPNWEKVSEEVSGKEGTILMDGGCTK